MFVIDSFTHEYYIVISPIDHTGIGIHQVNRASTCRDFGRRTKYIMFTATVATSGPQLRFPTNEGAT